MSALSGSAVWLALGTAVLQFLIVGSLIGLFTWALLSALGRRSPGLRYALACAALGLCLLSFAGSFALALTTSGSVFGLAAVGGTRLANLTAEELGGGLTPAGAAAIFWALGVLYMTLRGLRQIGAARRLRTAEVSAPDAHWSAVFESLRGELGIERAVRLLRSGLAEVPMVVGWLSPVVLVPLSAFTALSPDQLRALLAHELAHIRRHDPLVNVLQAVVEAVLFFHPGVWWISQQVRIEREYCCDDSSVRLVGDPRHLAEALTALERLRATQPTTPSVLAANGGSLMQRITRILGIRAHQHSSPPGWQLPTGLALAGALVGALALTGSALAAPTLQGEKPAQRKALPTRTEQSTAKAEYRRVQAELAHLVELGQLEKAQAAERLGALEQLLTRQRAQQALDAEAQRIDAAVAAGQLTAEQGQAKLEAYHREYKQKAGALDVKARYLAAQRKLEAGVAAGKLTPEQAKQHLAKLKVELFDQRSARPQSDLARLAEGLERAVAEGVLTREQAVAKLAEVHRKQADAPIWSERIVDDTPPAKPPTQTERYRRTRQDYERAVVELKLAVAEGELSAAEAEKKLAELRLPPSAPKVKTLSAEQYAQIKAKLTQAVAEGHLSAEHAEKKLVELREHLAKVPEKPAPDSKGGK